VGGRAALCAPPVHFLPLVIVYKPAEGISQRGLSQFLRQARSLLRLSGEVNVMLTSNGQMRTLNRQFRGKDRATDVLSFPAPPALASRFSGDIAISVDIAARSASRYGHSLMQELKVLVLHGVLHLAGYDHEQDNGTMARKEERLRRELGVQGGLIARSGKKAHSAVRQQVSSGDAKAGAGADTRKPGQSPAKARSPRSNSRPRAISLRQVR
jgi:probable rRNA maturation factor